VQSEDLRVPARQREDFALGDPSRRALVQAVAERGDATATELASGLPVTRQAVAKQLATLDLSEPFTPEEAAPAPGAAEGLAT